MAAKISAVDQPTPHEDAVARCQHDITVTQRREGDEREVECIVIGLECAEPDEEPSPQSHLCQMAEQQRHHGAERIQNVRRSSVAPRVRRPMKRTLTCRTACATTGSATVPLTARRIAANRPIEASRTVHSPNASGIPSAHSTPGCTTPLRRTFWISLRAVLPLFFGHFAQVGLWAEFLVLFGALQTYNAERRVTGRSLRASRRGHRARPQVA